MIGGIFESCKFAVPGYKAENEMYIRKICARLSFIITRNIR